MVDGRIPHVLLLELFTDAGIGTMVLPEDVLNSTELYEDTGDK